MENRDGKQKTNIPVISAPNIKKLHLSRYEIAVHLSKIVFGKLDGGRSDHTLLDQNQF